MKEAQILIQEYTNWLKKNITPRSIDANTIALDSPFLDRHNDFIQIYIVQKQDNMRLSDDGATIEDLRMDGFEFNSELRKSFLTSVLRGFGVALNEDTGELYTEANVRNFPAKKHALIQTILAVNDMYVLNRPNVRRLFHEEVAEYLTKRDKIIKKSKNKYANRNARERLNAFIKEASFDLDLNDVQVEKILTEMDLDPVITKEDSHEPSDYESEVEQ